MAEVSSLLNYTTLIIALGAGVLGAASGALGSFAVLRRQSLIGDALSHAALPGIVLAYMFTGLKSPIILMGGAAVAGVLGMLFALLVVNTTRVQLDSALGIVLSVFFGFGLVLLTFIQKQADAGQAGLDRFLFGQAAGLLRADVINICVGAALSGLLLLLFWKEFKLLAFDKQFCQSLGYPIWVIEVLLSGLITAAIVLGLQTVGVVLMSSMVVAPAAAARQWTNRLGSMVTLAAILGCTAGVIGAVLSSGAARLPTGPMVVVVAGAIVLISLLFAPQRGILMTAIRRWRTGNRLKLEAVLMDLLELETQHSGDISPRAHTVKSVQAMSFGHKGVRGALRTLKEQELVSEPEPGFYKLTDAGRAAARQVASPGAVVAAVIS